MEIYSTEEQQVEAIKGWWHQHGTQVIIGAVIGLGSIWGWRAWSDHQLAKQEQNSAEFTQVVDAMQSTSDSAVLKAFIERQGDSGYAALASLLAARQAVENNQLAEAESLLRQAQGLLTDPAVEPLVRLRLARVLAAQDKTDEALVLVEQEVNLAWTAEYAELRGDLHLQRGETEKAREAYQLALAGQASNPLLEMKLADLTGL